MGVGDAARVPMNTFSRGSPCDVVFATDDDFLNDDGFPDDGFPNDRGFLGDDGFSDGDRFTPRGPFAVAYAKLDEKGPNPTIRPFLRFAVQTALSPGPWRDESLWIESCRREGAVSECSAFEASQIVKFY